VSVEERNVQLLMDGLDAFSRGDLRESLGSMHPDIEWHVAFRLPDLPLPKDVYRGRDEVEVLWKQFRSAWDEMTVRVEEILYVDESRVMARARFRGRGKESGVEVDRLVFYAFRIQDELLIYCRAFDDEASARADLGLEASRARSGRAPGAGFSRARPPDSLEDGG
jgi:ketosteroid isomerase-like protein